MSIKLGLLAIGASMVMASSALATTATTIISDTFPSTQGIGSGAYLQGSSPDTGPTGATWTTHYDGSTGLVAPTTAQAPFISTNSAGADAAIFPDSYGGNVDAAIAFTPVNSTCVLTLTATLNFVGGEWIGMGFAPSATNADPSVSTGPWALMTGSGSTVQLFGKNGSRNLVPTTKLTSSTNTLSLSYDPVTTDLTLDVSNGISGSNYITASDPLSYFGVTTAPSIGAIFFAVRGGGTTNGSNFSDVTLTQGPEQVVPEPATVGLFGMGAAAGLLLLGRRRKTA